MRRYALILACAVPAYASAADVYYLPRLELRAEGHTNRDLRPDDDDEGELAGYVADGSLQIGRRSPTGELTVTPRLRYSDYPERENIQKLEQFLDLRGTHNTERSNFGIVGRYARRDAYFAEFPGAELDPLDPEAPPIDGSGRLAVDVTRSIYELRPSFGYRLSPRHGIGGGIQVQRVDYSPNLSASQVDYNFGRADIGWRWQYDERSRLEIGPYVGRYEARDDSYESDAYGILVQYEREVSERFSTGITMRVEYESEEVRAVGLPAVSEDDTGFELMLNMAGTGEVSQWRVRAGRAIVPTGAGSIADSDELHADYTRALSPRFSTQAALRAMRIRSRSIRGLSDDRDYVSGRLALSYALTPTWSVLGGYEGVWREYLSDTGSALDHAVFVSARFTGLGPQR